MFVCPHHVLAQGPVLGEDVQEGEGDGEGAQQDVREGHVGDEDVASCEHFLATSNFSGHPLKITLKLDLLDFWNLEIGNNDNKNNELMFRLQNHHPPGNKQLFGAATRK